MKNDCILDWVRNRDAPGAHHMRPVKCSEVREAELKEAQAEAWERGRKTPHTTICQISISPVCICPNPYK